jgi:hypothetical protein
MNDLDAFDMGFTSGNNRFTKISDNSLLSLTFFPIWYL